MAEIESGTVTNAGAQYIAEKTATLGGVVIDHFVLANIPGVDETTVADPELGLPDLHYIVNDNVRFEDGNDSLPIPARYNNDKAVTYSLVLGSDKGDYDFNYYAAVTETGVVLAYQYLPMNRKRAGIGQVINRNLVVPFQNAKMMTGADLPVESWQFDNSAEVQAIKKTVYANSLAVLQAQSILVQQANQQMLLTERVRVLESNNDN